jgi:hypothetical protein
MVNYMQGIYGPPPPTFTAPAQNGAGNPTTVGLTGSVGVAGGAGNQAGAIALLVLLGSFVVLYWGTRSIQGSR